MIKRAKREFNEIGNDILELLRKEGLEPAEAGWILGCALAALATTRETAEICIAEVYNKIESQTGVDDAE